MQTEKLEIGTIEMNRQKVLVVEDSKTQSVLISRSLINKGYDVIAAFDGGEAIEKVCSELPQCIVMDIVLSKQYNGFQLCRLFKRSPLTQNIPVILLSSKQTELDKSWGRRQGADLYLTKPCHFIQASTAEPLARNWAFAQR